MVYEKISTFEESWDTHQKSSKHSLMENINSTNDKILWKRFLTKLELFLHFKWHSKLHNRLADIVNSIEH